jgi:arylsulfatase A-like enzyme
MRVCSAVVVTSLVLLRGLAAADTSPVSRPNIIVILADDFGWGSLGCYGATGLKTPHLDRLAREGRRFTHAYAPGSVCSPTRYGLMTGRYYWRTSIKDGEVLPGNAPLHIETDRLTLASLCKQRGYRTAAFGKWHLGMTGDRITDWGATLRPGPLEIGFDYFFGLGANPWNGPHNFIRNDSVLDRRPGEPLIVSGNRESAVTSGLEKSWQETEIMQRLTGEVTGWIAEHAKDPFFVYYAPTAIHEPIVPNQRFSGSPYGKYGDFIHELDRSVGEVLRAIDEQQLADRTLIVFTSDNGGVVNPNNANAKGAMEAGLAINGPLRGGKHDEWEGGFREPFLVRWPGHVPAGSVSDQVLSITDVLATLAAVLDVPLPAGQAEDSFNMLAAWTGSAAAPSRAPVIIQSADATYAIRSGDWKLIERVDAPAFEHRNRRKAELAERKRRQAAQHDELFNLREDPTEQHDVSAAHPEIVTELKSQLRAAREAGHTRTMDALPASR